MTEPLVSILIPTYNGERFLKATLRSALEQSHRTIEVLVGDDASTDRTPEILAAVTATDDRIRVIRRERNVGAFENPLQLLAEARGEYVKFLLHDDVLTSDCVRELVRGMQSEPDVSLAFSRRSLMDENGRPVAGHEFPRLSDRPGTLDGRELGNLVLEQCNNVIGELTTILFRRADVEVDGLWQVDGRRLDVLNDLKLSLQLLARGRAWYTPRVLSRFRMHPGQNSFDSAIVARGMRDWPKLLDWGVQEGFLSDPAAQRRAFVRALQMAAVRTGELIDRDHGPSLEGAFLATVRLVELAAGVSAEAGSGLQRRAHQQATLARFVQELDVWTRTYPVALAAPALNAGELRATVAAFRELATAGVAQELRLAVPEQASALVEAALAEAPELSVDIVPTDDPATLPTGAWLAVATRGSTWHDGSATAVWTVDAATS